MKSLTENYRTKDLQTNEVEFAIPKKVTSIGLAFAKDLEERTVLFGEQAIVRRRIAINRFKDNIKSLEQLIQDLN